MMGLVLDFVCLRLAWENDLVLLEEIEMYFDEEHVSNLLPYH